MVVRHRALQWVALAGWLALAYAAATVGALASVQAAEFYASLHQPVWAPPPGVFGPVWTVLYTLMGVAVWRVWCSPAPRRMALTLFCVQLAANSLWSWLFFAWRLGAVASVEVVVLFALIAATIAAFWRISRIAAALLLPYLAWVGFASLLTLALWRGNPDLL